MPQPLVSFLIPAYNVAPFIEDTLASVLSARRDDIEVVVVDDGSTDDTARILAAMTDPRVQIVHQPNKGLPATRNTGIANSRGEFLVFLDGDDLYDMGTLDAMVGALQSNPAAVLSYGNNVKFISGGHRQVQSPYGTIKARPSGMLLEQILQRNFIGPPGCCCVRRSATGRVGLFDDSLLMGEDWEFYCRLATAGPFVFVPVTCLHYRQHPASMSKGLGLKRESYGRFTDVLFAEPAIVQAFTPHQLRRLRRSHDAHIRGFMSIRALEAGALGKSLRELGAAILSYPPRTAEFAARYIWIALQRVLPTRPR